MRFQSLAKISQFLCTSLILCLACFGVAYAAIAPAGTKIKNIAEADYHREMLGQPGKIEVDPNTNLPILYKTHSNLDGSGNPVPVIATVKPVYLAQFLPDNSLVASPDETIIFAHQLKNTGNITDSYTFSASDLGGDDGVLENMQLVYDRNNDGKYESKDGDIIITPTTAITLDSGQTASILLIAKVPQAVTFGQHFDAQVNTKNTAIDPLEQISLTRFDTVTIAQPNLKLIKTVDKTTVNISSTAADALLLNYSLIFSNKKENATTGAANPATVSIDGKNEQRVVFDDPLPANVIFKGITYSGAGQLLYRKPNTAAKTYLKYDVANPPNKSDVAAIAFAFTDFAVDRSEQATITVQVLNNAMGATIVNQFQGYYHYGVEDKTVVSTLAQTEVTGTASIRPKDQNYNIIGRVALDGDIYLEANCAQCNVRPNAIDRLLLQIKSQKSGDIETVVAIETDINTGVFRINDDNLSLRDALPTRDMFLFAPTSGNYIIETIKHDVLTATILYCLDDANIERPNSKVNVSDNILIDPFGVVFDSKTNMPIANAIVHLVREDGSPAEIFDDAQKRCTPPRDPQADPSCPENGIITTGPTGEYRFPFVPVARYRLIITPPAGYSYPSVVPLSELEKFHRAIKTDGSYGFAFDVTPQGPVEIDVPMDPPLVFSSTLFVKKTTPRSVVEVGDFVDYQIVVSNVSKTTDAIDVLLIDKLPQGFAYVLGSAKVNSVAQEPKGGRGPTLTFSAGDIKTDQEVTITYRAQVGVGALRSDAINRARAQENVVGGIYSAEAIAKVTVSAGVFTSEAYVTGKVYTDCNRSGVQDNEEIGVPNVRLILEDGSYVITDIEGKFNFYGLRPKTHVLKLDRTTLPSDVELIEQNVRHAGDPASRFVDLKAGELHRADFAITTDSATCSGPAMTEIYSRRNQGDQAVGELERALKADLTFETSNPSDVRSLPASGCLITTGTGNDCGVHGKAKLPTLSTVKTKTTNEEDIMRVAKSEPSQSLDSYLAGGASNQLEILNLKDKQVLPYAQTNILVKGTLGARFELRLNDKLVSEDSIGTKLALAERQLEAREYIGINLVEGENRIALKQFDGMGNARGTSVLMVTAPGQLASLKLSSEAKVLEADGNNETVLHVKLLDKHDVPVTTRTQITLESNMGRFRAVDLDPVAPGIQLFIEGGEFSVKYVAPTEAGEAIVSVKSGTYHAETNVRFVPELRPMIAAGIIEGMVSFKNFDTNKVSTANAQDGFEDELQSLASANDGQLNVNGRAAMFLKGKVKGEYLLTLSYDSDKDNKQRLFRDIRPEDYYPVYGDSAVKGFDAQSTSKLYVRLDKGRSYAMFGDYTSRIENSEALSLGQYSRSLTGVRGHYETDTFKTTVFAAQTKSKQVVIEVPAQGISGPYQLAGIDGLLVNSEKVEVILRDRNNPGLILSSVPQARFVDYDFEPLSSSLYFKSAVPSLDANLNPFSIRVTVEIEEEGGEDYVVGGAQAETKLTDYISVGAAVVQEDAPDDAYSLRSANTTIKLNDYTRVIAEVAQSDRETTETGIAQRVELAHNKGGTNLRVYYGQSDLTFDNPAASLNAGRSESGYKLQQNIDKWILRSEAVYSEDVKAGSIRQGATASVERKLNQYLAFEIGSRYYDETTTISGLGSTPYQGVTARGKLNLQIPKLDAASAYAEYEQDIENTGRKLMAIGGDYRIGKQGRLYARHEFISSLSGNFGLNDQQERNSTVFGVESSYMKDGRVFSEYRVRDAIAAKDVEAAIGLRNRWYLSKDIRANTSFERVTTLEGADNTDATAVSLALEYLTNPLWKATGKIDLRWADQTDTILNTLGLAYKLSRDWTLLARNTINFTDNHTLGDRLQDRFQLGAAYRQVDTNRWDTLTKIEYKIEEDESSLTNPIERDAYIFSTHINYHPVRRWTFANQYAGKWVNDTRDNVTSRSATYLVGLRAIHDITERWEGSLQAGALGGETGGKRYVLGAETGYLVTTNLWLSVGYNWLNYNDSDVVGSEFTVDGAYLRMRFKFDEDLFNADKPRINKTLEAQNASR